MLLTGDWDGESVECGRTAKASAISGHLAPAIAHAPQAVSHPVSRRIRFVCTGKPPERQRPRHTRRIFRNTEPVWFIELEGYLSKLLGVKVDLVMKGTLKPLIGRQILNEVVGL